MTRAELLSYAFFVALGLLAGALLTVQAGVNAGLARRLGQPVLATLASFLIGSVALLAYALVMRLPLPALAEARQIPPGYWVGGLLGAVYVLSTTVLAPQLGAAGMVSVIVAGQMLISLLLDHFGLIGFPVQPVTAGRLAGALLLVAGVVLVLRM